MQTIAIFGRNPKRESFPVLQMLFDELEKHEIKFLVYDQLYSYLKDIFKFKKKPLLFKNKESLESTVDMIFSLGGDGTLLNTLPIVQDSNIPVLGINIGRLGFLTSVGKEEVSTLLSTLKNGEYYIDRRSILSVQTSTVNPFKLASIALNDFVLYRKDSASMIIVHVYLDDVFLNSYWADGLIVATPTGSTGYSLSCGGPIIFPTSENFVVTPIAPHNLNVRPIIISDSSKLKIEVESRIPKYLVSLDSRVQEFSSRTIFTLQKSDFQFPLVMLKDVTFLKRLRNKLNWGLDSRN